jgi:ubiquitin C-terminal hydrolase
MNAILQCLINIDVFSSELMSNYEIIKLLNKIQAVNQIEDSAKSIMSMLEDEVTTLDSNESKNKDRETLYMCLCELLKAREALDMSLQVQSLKEVKNAISKEAIRFSGYQQNDAHEFLCQVLDQLKDDFLKFDKKYEENSEAIRNDKNNLKVVTMTNPIEDTFQFVVRHSVECKA